MTRPRRKVVDASVVVPFPVLRAMASAVLVGGLGLHPALILQSFAIGWFKAEIAAGGHLCPVCGNLWSTREKRLACDHKGGDPHQDTVEIIGAWIRMAEERP